MLHFVGRGPEVEQQDAGSWEALAAPGRVSEMGALSGDGCAREPYSDGPRAAPALRCFQGQRGQSTALCRYSQSFCVVASSLSPRDFTPWQLSRFHSVSSGLCDFGSHSVPLLRRSFWLLALDSSPRILPTISSKSYNLCPAPQGSSPRSS